MTAYFAGTIEYAEQVTPLPDRNRSITAYIDTPDVPLKADLKLFASFIVADLFLKGFPKLDLTRPVPDQLHDEFPSGRLVSTAPVGRTLHTGDQGSIKLFVGHGYPAFPKFRL